MERSFKILSFFSVLVSSCLILAALNTNMGLGFIKKKISAGLSFTIYMNEDYSSSDIAYLKKLFNKFKGIKWTEYKEPVPMEELLSEDKTVRNHFRLIKTDSLFPPSFKVDASSLEKYKLINLLKGIEDAEVAQYVDINASEIEAVFGYLSSLFYLKTAVNVVAVLMLMILMFISSYFYMISEADKISTAKVLSYKYELPVLPFILYSAPAALVPVMLSAAFSVFIPEMLRLTLIQHAAAALSLLILLTVLFVISFRYYYRRG